MAKIPFNIEYHEKQRDIFFNNKTRFKVIPKGRRFGLTHGMMYYAIDRAWNPKHPQGEKILWVDTTYSNIQRYIKRYGMPLLSNLPKTTYHWNKTNSEICITTEVESIIDFRSADRPENIEGFGYTLVILNEAGIILRNPSLWLESIRPMMLDYKADAIIGGTPKGKKYRGKEHLFYTLSKKGTPPKSSPLEMGRTFEQGDLFPSAEDINKNPPPFEKDELRRASWVTMNFSSYDNEMLEKKDIDELASEISPMLRDQEIYGLFVDVETDRIIKREWFDVTSATKNTKGHENASTPLSDHVGPQLDIKGKSIQRGEVIQSWDTAFKKNEENDYSVCTTWVLANDKYYLIDIFRERLEFPELKKKVVELNEKFNPNEIIIEEKASGISLIQELQRNTVLPIKAIKVSKDKISRVHSITPIVEAGNVALYSQMDASTATQRGIINDFLDECEDFPNGEFDDMVDSMSQALEYFRTMKKIESPKTISKRYRKRKIY